MTARRQLIVNADDFGQSPGVNEGIITAHERGIVTSASLMVRWPAAATAAAYARAHPQFSVGLHLDLSEWAFRAGGWVALYEVVTPTDEVGVRAEAARQLSAFRGLMGRDPSHLDSHQHAHRDEPIRSILLGVGRELGVPVRHFSAAVRYHGGFYGQMDQGQPYPEGISVQGLLAILTALAPGVTELGCHPGDRTDLDTMYREEGVREVSTLCDPRVGAALRISGIELCSFHPFRIGIQ